jgi:hypothetical protein
MCDRAHDYQERVTGAPGIVPSPIVYMTRRPQSVIRNRALVFEDLRAVSCTPDSADRLHAVCIERQPLILLIGSRPRKWYMG